MGKVHRNGTLSPDSHAVEWGLALSPADPAPALLTVTEPCSAGERPGGSWIRDGQRWTEGATGHPGEGDRQPCLVAIVKGESVTEKGGRSPPERKERLPGVTQ